MGLAFNCVEHIMRDVGGGWVPATCIGSGKYVSYCGS